MKEDLPHFALHYPVLVVTYLLVRKRTLNLEYVVKYLMLDVDILQLPHFDPVQNTVIDA